MLTKLLSGSGSVRAELIAAAVASFNVRSRALADSEKETGWIGMGVDATALGDRNDQFGNDWSWANLIRYGYFSIVITIP